MDTKQLFKISDYLDPFLKQLSALSQFTVRSQWLYFVSLGVQPNKVEDGYELEKDMLPHILIPLEKKLGEFEYFLLYCIVRLSIHCEI